MRQDWKSMENSSAKENPFDWSEFISKARGMLRSLSTRIRRVYKKIAILYRLAHIKSIWNFIKIFIFARNLQLNPIKVTVGYEGDYTPREFDFNEDVEIGVLDCHLSILSHQSTRKTGIVLTLTGSNGEPVEFHVGIKNGKDSLRFEILDSSGLAQAKLSNTSCLFQV